MLGKVIEQRRAIEVPARAVNEADGIERVFRNRAGRSLVDPSSRTPSRVWVWTRSTITAASCERSLRKA